MMMMLHTFLSYVGITSSSYLCKFVLLEQLSSSKSFKYRYFFFLYTFAKPKDLQAGVLIEQRRKFQQFLNVSIVMKYSLDVAKLPLHYSWW